MSGVQEFIDQAYFQHGPCCGGCDWWRHLNSRVGECQRSAPVAAIERNAMLGIERCSMSGLGAGHVLTSREHLCGDFKDDFDWSSLPLAYLKRIGAPTARAQGNPNTPDGETQ